MYEYENYDSEELEDDFAEDYNDEDEVDEDDSGTVKVTLPKPHAGQRLVLQSKVKWRILCCGRRWGKSFICLILSLEKMFKGQSVAYITPTYSLGQEFYREILNFIPQKIIASANKSDLSITLLTKGEIKFFSGEAIRDIRGRKYHRVIIDEAAFIPDLQSHWTEAIAGTLANTNGDALFVSTPNGRNYFYSLFIKGKDRVDNYESFHFPSSSSPYVSKQFLETIQKDIPYDTFRQEYLAEPLSSVGNPFGEEHIKKNIIDSLSTEETIVYGIDVAKHNDWTVIIGLDEDGNMTYFDRFRGEWSLIEQKVKELPSNLMKVIDSTGVGDVIFERLQQTADNVHGFKFTSKSKPALMKELIVDVQQGRLKYNKVVAEEMQSFEFSLTPSGHPQYEAQSGYHDDCIMALAIANHYKKQAWNVNNWRLYTA